MQSVHLGKNGITFKHVLNDLCGVCLMVGRALVFELLYGKFFLSHMMDS